MFLTMVVNRDCLAGNYSLCKVLPSIYQLKQYEYAINDHLSALLSILPLCDHNDRLSLLGLFELMAKSDASVSMIPAPDSFPNQFTDIRPSRESEIKF